MTNIINFIPPKSPSPGSLPSPQQFKMMSQLRASIIEAITDPIMAGPVTRHHQIVWTALMAVAAATSMTIALSKEDFIKMAAEVHQSNADEENGVDPDDAG